MLEPISAHCVEADSAKKCRPIRGTELEKANLSGHRVGKSQLIRAQSWKKPTNQGREWENGQPIRAENGKTANQSGLRMGQWPTNQGREWVAGCFPAPKHLYTLYCWPFSFKSVCFLFLQARLKIHPAEYIQ